MPRCARVKSNDSTYHIMIRSVGDIPLYKNDDDKVYFMNLFKKYKEMFIFKVYSYCLMDTHAHFIIYSNGADVSRFMHGINQSYAQYYNKKYNRHGHVFGDRFKSCIVNDERYLITLSGYIHNNPSDIKGYENSIYTYPYSSLGIYLGLARDRFNILDISFLLNRFSKDIIIARKLYSEFIANCTDMDLKNEIEFKDEMSQYRSERKILVRNFTPKQVAEFVSKYTGNDASNIHIKYSRKAKNLRAVCILLMRSLCNLTYKQICEATGNITASQASKLSAEGFEIINKDPRFTTIIEDLIQVSRTKSGHKINIS